jgi:hypothetical protein
MAQTAWSALIGGGLLLLFGLYYWNAELTGISDSSIYNAFVDVMVWTLVVGGVLNLISAAVLFLGWRSALAADGIIAVATGGMLMLIGLVRMVHHFSDGSLDLQAILLLVFGGMFIRSGLGSWQAHVSLAEVRSRPDSPSPQHGSSVQLEGLKESARERLLQTKSKLRGDADPAMPVSPPASRVEFVRPKTAEPVVPDTPPLRVQELPAATDAGTRRPDHPEAAVSEADAVEDGFLAELGRADENERK